jgi:branched-chain amino acid transport system substrate-binding protein
MRTVNRGAARWALTCLVALAATAIAGCGDEEDDGAGTKAEGKTLTVYSSLPLQGAARVQSQDILRGEKLALKEAGGKVGQFKIRLVSLDDATAQAGTWTPEQTAANARKALGDDSTIAYLGEYNSGASAISLPILNEGMVPQVSPATIATGLTTTGPGADEGEPEKYYPTGERTYVRVVPRDAVQGAALATLMQDEGCEQAYLINDQEVYGEGLAASTEAAAKTIGLEVIGNEGIEKTSPNFRSTADKIASEGADCVVFTGITANGAVQLFKDLAAGLPDAKLFGSSGVAEAAFTDPAEGGIPSKVAARVVITAATLPRDRYPPEGQKFFRDFEREYGEENPATFAIYGYEAMALVLDAMKRAGAQANNREAVLKELFATSGRESVLGTYDIDRNGDTSLTITGTNTIQDGQLVAEKAIEPKGLDQ